jgi:long-subunit fatty acid transport protein
MMGGKLTLMANAGVGVDIFGFTMNGTESALIQGASPSMGVSAGGSYKINPKLHAGIGMDFTMASGSDLQYQTAASTTGGTAYSRSDIRAHAEVAWGDSWTVAARAGYLYSNLSITSDSVETLMTGEEIAGLTVGVGGTVPVGKKLGVAASLDFMPAGVERPSERPASGLYGDSTKAAWLSAGLTYQLPYRLAATAMYRFGYGSTSFTDGAETNPVTASRDDQYHTVIAGLGFHL